MNKPPVICITANVKGGNETPLPFFSFSLKGKDEVSICQKSAVKTRKVLFGQAQNAILQGEAVVHPVGKVDIVGDHYG